MTKKRLDGLAAAIGRMLGAPAGPAWTKREDGSNRATVGYVFCEPGSADNGISWKLCRMTSESGAESVILTAGTARELYDLMHAFMSGMDYAKARFAGVQS